MTIAELNTLNTNVKPEDPFDNPVFHAAKDVGILSWTIAPEKWGVISDVMRVEDIAEDFLTYTIDMSNQGRLATTATADDILRAYNTYTGSNLYTPIYRIRELLKFYIDVLLYY